MNKSKSSQRGRPPKKGSLNWLKRNGPAHAQQMNEELSHTSLVDTRINIIAVAAGSGPSKNKNNSSSKSVFSFFKKFKIYDHQN